MISPTFRSREAAVGRRLAPNYQKTSTHKLFLYLLPFFTRSPPDLHWPVAFLCRPDNLDNLSIYLSIGINVRFAAMMADVGDGLL